MYYGYMIPQDAGELDLSYLRYADGRQTIIVTLDGWISSEAPIEDFPALLARQIRDHVPQLFASDEDCELYLVALHEHFMQRGENLARLPYPIFVRA
jgi:hypothetical protein